jgi:hypothetical protein
VVFSGSARSVTITTPAAGSTYSEGDVVDASYECEEGTDGPGLLLTSEGCEGTVANGTAISTTGAGEHHFTVKATSSDGLTEAKTVSYNVAPPPTVTTEAPSSVTHTSATLAGSVNPNGWNVTRCTIEYGVSLPSGESVPCSPSPGSGSSPVSVSGAVGGLTANTTYEYRLIATYAGGTSTSASRSFTTSGPPEFGRCLKVPAEKGVYHGGFTASGCVTASATHTGESEWYPAVGGSEPLVKRKFATAVKPASELKLETKDKQKISCTGETSGGEYTSNKSVSGVTLTLTGCRRLLLKGATESCQSSGRNEGEVVTDALDGELGVITASSEGAAKNRVGLDLKPASGEAVAAFECGAMEVSIDGSVSVPVSVNRMALTQALKYTRSKAVQKPVRFEGGSEDVLQARLGTGSFEQTGLTLTSTLTNEEKVEINSVM